MRQRRQLIESCLGSNQFLLTLPIFPRMGASEFGRPLPPSTHGPAMDSAFLSDQIISSHPRFATLARNIRTRRGERVQIFLPLFIDSNTEQSIERLIEQELTIQHPASKNSNEIPAFLNPPALADDLKRLPLDRALPLHFLRPASFRSTSPSTPFDSSTPSSLPTRPSIYADAMAFGMGNCCLQVTFQGLVLHTYML